MAKDSQEFGLRMLQEEVSGIRIKILEGFMKLSSMDTKEILVSIKEVEGTFLLTLLPKTEFIPLKSQPSLCETYIPLLVSLEARYSFPTWAVVMAFLQLLMKECMLKGVTLIIVHETDS